MTLRGLAGTVFVTVAALAVVGGIVGEEPYTGAADNPPQPAAADTLRISGDARGQFWTDCRISNVAMRCPVDTASTAEITLDRATARRLGIDVAQLRFTSQVQTANGVVRAAKTRVATLRVGPFNRSDVPAVVVDSDTGGEPLLGMAFLRQYKVTMAADLLVISSE
jgi:clan AA aspartic protease (TIGR02281 family)